MIQSIDKVNRWLIRLLQVVYLNFLWTIVTLLGLGIFSIGPATYAMVSVYRKWLRSREVFPLTRTYIYYFKENYKESVVISWIYLVVGVILVVDLLYVTNWYLRALLLMVGFIYLLSLIYIFPVMAHYNWQGYFFKIKMAFLFGFAQLQYSLLLMLVIGVIYWLIGQFIPGIFTFMGISFLLLAVTWTGNQVFCLLEAENMSGVEHKSIIKKAKEKIDEKRKISKAGS